MKIRPDVRSALAASRADGTQLKFGEPDFIRPRIGAGCDVVAAPIITALDRDAAHAGLAHLAEGDLLRAVDGSVTSDEHSPL